MRTNPGWHGYWLNPGDAGLPMDVDWQLPKGFVGGPAALSGAEPADRRRADELCLRARLCGAGPAQGAGGRAAARSRSAPTRTGSPAPTRSACPSRASCRSILPVGAGTPNRAQFDAWRRALPQPLATVGAFRAERRQLRVAIPLPAASRSASPTLPDHRQGASIMRRRRSFRRTGDCADRRAERQRRAPGRSSMACWRSATGAGWNFTPCRAPSRTAARRLAASAREGDAARRCSARSLGGILLNLMPCVFPILALKALHLARAGGSSRKRAARRAGLYGGRDRRHRRARRASARDPRRRARRRAGRSSCRIRARSCCCCCWRPRSPLNLARPVRASGARRRAAPAGGRLRHRRARGLRRDALRRPVPGRRAGHGAAAAASGIGRWCSPRSALASPCRSCCSPLFRRLRSRLPKPGPWMDTAAAHSRDPDGGERGRGTVAALPAGGQSTALVVGLLAVAVLAGCSSGRLRAAAAARRRLG